MRSPTSTALHSPTIHALVAKDIAAMATPPAAYALHRTVTLRRGEPTRATTNDAITPAAPPAAKTKPRDKALAWSTCRTSRGNKTVSGVMPTKLARAAPNNVATSHFWLLT